MPYWVVLTEDLGENFVPAINNEQVMSRLAIVEFSGRDQPVFSKMQLVRFFTFINNT
jgi:hypothetical protein